MENRNQVFQRLKPRCVNLSQNALALNGPRGNVQLVTEDLSDLRKILSDISVGVNTLDEKLADYVFFPLSQVLKVSQKVSVRCLELSLQCLSILIERGWRSQLQPQLAGQIVILCTLMAEKDPKGLNITETTNELQESALKCLHSLFSALDPDSESRRSLIAENNVPQLGQTISVGLDGMEDGGSPELQIVACNTLRALLDRVATPEIRASFLPGVVSRLTKVITSQARQRRNPRVLIGSLNIMISLFLSVLSDKKDSSSAAHAVVHQDGRMKEYNPDQQWLETAATQLKPALSSIMRLKEHGRQDVRESLAQLCLVLLRDCKINLANCASIALETVIFLASDPLGDSINATLTELVRNDGAFSRLLQDTVYQKMQSLPTTMQSSDTQKKVQQLQQVYTAYAALTEPANVNTILDKSLAKVLRESTVITLLESKIITHDLTSVPLVQSLDLTISDTNKKGLVFSSSIAQNRGQEDVIKMIAQLSRFITQSSAAPSFCDDLVQALHSSEEDMQVASFWLLLNTTEAAIERSKNLDQFIDVKSSPPEYSLESLETLYSFALSTLNDSSEEPKDPRLRSLSLRALALQAQISEHDFRYELIDALYPVLHSMATPDQMLQNDSIVTLNVFASSCGYGSVEDLIVSNVDYLTNAVALKLNAFDVSPQAPQVLLMMVRLAGPSLLPYLEDTIESIFAALEDYHGYPLLVELLFKALSVVAEEGTKTTQLAITHPTGLNLLPGHQTQPEPMTMLALADLIRTRAEEDTQQRPSTPIEERSHPRQPWKSKAQETIDQDDDDDDDNTSNPDDSDNENPESTESPPPETNEVDIPPPAPKTYGILLKITELTQHFLPSASPSLRTSLLGLIRTTAPALARHENSFLPLINTLWPEIVSRLDDPEPYILAAALDVVGTLCEFAGDFMRSRVLQLWPRVMELWRRRERGEERAVRDVGWGKDVRSEASLGSLSSVAAAATSTTSALVLKEGRKGEPGAVTAFYRDSADQRVREALRDVIRAIVRFVDTSPEVFDEALQALRTELEQPSVLAALEAGNADAVWLVRMRAGSVPVPPMPTVDGSRRWKFASVLV